MRLAHTSQSFHAELSSIAAIIVFVDTASIHVALQNNDETLYIYKPFFLIMSKTFKLFALGSNGCGQLGVGHQDDTAIPQLCKFEEEDVESIGEDNCIRKIAAGGNHTLVLFNSGAVFAAGSNESGQCYVDSRIAQRSVFKRITVQNWHDPAQPSETPVFVDISATWEASFLLDTKGRVFSFGRGLKGELGGGDRLTATGDFHDAPLRVFWGNRSKIKRLYSSMRHTIAIGDDGDVYGWGSCRRGELGSDLEHRKEIWSPEKLSVTSQCEKAALGRNFTILVGTDACKVFGRDQALEGIAALGNTPFKAIEAGWSTVYTLVNKRVRSFGRNDRGQCPSDDLPDLSRFAAGSEHCLGLTSTGQTVAWGWGEHGNCGRPPDPRYDAAGRWNVLAIPLNEDEAIIDVAAGCATSFVVVGTKPS